MDMEGINPLNSFGLSAFAQNYAQFINNEQSASAQEFSTVFMTQLLRQGFAETNRNALYGESIGTAFLNDFLVDQLARELVQNQTLGFNLER